VKSGCLAPTDPEMLEVGDIVPCKVSGNEYLHIVKAIENGRNQIGNNRGFINDRPRTCPPPKRPANCRNCDSRISPIRVTESISQPRQIRFFPFRNIERDLQQQCT
jgi:hypothetical protein